MVKNREAVTKGQTVGLFFSFNYKREARKEFGADEGCFCILILRQLHNSMYLSKFLKLDTKKSEVFK